MVGMYGARVCADCEPCVVPLVVDADVCFVACDAGVGRGLMLEVELVAEDGSGVRVIEHGLI